MNSLMYRAFTLGLQHGCSIRDTGCGLKSLVFGLMAMVMAVTACDRRPLEVIVAERVNVRLVVNWRFYFDRPFSTTPTFDTSLADSAFMDSAAYSYYGGVPNGMTFMLWGRNTGDRIVQTANGHTATVSLRPDTYQLIVFSNTEDEYHYMSLRNRDSFDDVTMRLHHYAASDARADGGEYIWYPDPIGVAVDTFEITRQMAMRDTIIFVPYDDYLDGHHQRQTESEHYWEIPERATPMTVTLYVKAKVKHRQSMKSIKASISGMAEGFYLSRINRTTESGTIELDPNGWQFVTYGEESDSMGIIANKTATFGLPYGKELLAERNAEDNVLSFNILLANDSVQRCSFNVGKDIRYLTPEGREAQVRYRQDLHDLRLEIDLSDVIVMPPMPARGGAGFDAKVLDWEEGGTFDIGGF